MAKLRICLIAIALCLGVACSPRDFLTRRLARDLISGSEAFNATQLFLLRTGVVSNKQYLSPEYLVLQHRGWITGGTVPCAADKDARARAVNRGGELCWDVALTPAGVETFRSLIPNNAEPAQYTSVPVARRVLVDISGISADVNVAEVDFTWKWLPLNEVGSALYPGDVPYNSTVTFKRYDDGWRVMKYGGGQVNQDLEDALRNALPAP